MEIPETFIEWAYKGRAELIRRQAEGERVPPHEIFLGFSRHTPAIVSNGPAGLNASIKGVGFVPRPEHVQETLDAYMVHIEGGWRQGYQAEGLQLLMRHLYGEGCRGRIDFGRVGSLELARDHTWDNLRADATVTLLFYQPPAVSFEIRGTAQIHEFGSVYHQLLNAQHDVYHKPDQASWPERPAYVFEIAEIYDNSATKSGFGKRIY